MIAALLATLSACGTPAPVDDVVNDSWEGCTVTECRVDWAVGRW